MNSLTDQQLLRDYAGKQSDAAFAELVRRYVDLVYSTALRMVCDAHLAQDVTQGVFVALAQNARPLAEHPVLSGWLHRTARNLAANNVRSETRRRTREQEAVAMNLLNETETDWQAISLHLDDSLCQLDEADRDALMLRYFERKSAREMADVLGLSEEAAQKRASRAVERLREIFSKRRVTIGAAGLAALISANAVQAAPVGLATAISTALAGAAVQTSTLITATKTIAMTTLQKSIIVVALAGAAGTGIYAARQDSELQARIQALDGQQGPLMTQLQKMQMDYAAATNELAALQGESTGEKSDSNDLELLRLRGEVTRLESQTQPGAATDNDPFVQSVMALAARAEKLKGLLQQMPNEKIPELQLLNENDWLNAVQNDQLDSDADIRKAFQKLRSIAKNKLPIGSSLYSYAHDNNGQLPNSLSQLDPYIESDVQSEFGVSLDDSTLSAILDRYTLLHTGNASDFPSNAWFVVEKAPVDEAYDSREKFGLGTSSNYSTGLGESGDPDDTNY